MNRGILFSMDAVLALIVVILLVAWLPQQFNAVEEYGGASENLHYKALDNAIKGLYKNLPSSPPISPSAKVAKCAVVYTLNPNNSLGTRASPEAQSFCEEIE